MEIQPRHEPNIKILLESYLSDCILILRDYVLTIQLCIMLRSDMICYHIKMNYKKRSVIFKIILQSHFTDFCPLMLSGKTSVSPNLPLM